MVNGFALDGAMRLATVYVRSCVLSGIFSHIFTRSNPYQGNSRSRSGAPRFAGGLSMDLVCCLGVRFVPGRLKVRPAQRGRLTMWLGCAARVSVRRLDFLRCSDFFAVRPACGIMFL